MNFGIVMANALSIDWNEVWNSQLQLHRSCSVTRNWEWARIWERKDSAQKFWDLFSENKERVDIVLRETSISPKSRILDVGAGPGLLAIPFAAKVEHVTAVEPSEGMVSVLREQMEKHDAKNISIVKKRWEDVNIIEDLEPPYDVVIASMSLDMLNIRRAIYKMEEASSKYIYLYHFAGGDSDVHLRELWPKLHGREYYSGPKSDVLYNVLYQMGIYPHVSTFTLDLSQKYNSVQELLNVLRSKYEVKTEKQELILRDHFGRILKESNGTFIIQNYSTRVKMWWDKEFMHSSFVQ